MRTSIKLTGYNAVTLTAIDPYSGEAIKWEFFIPIRGGYVRRSGRHGDLQVCQRLATRGGTLWCKDGSDLLMTIRREWKRYRAEARREWKKYRG